MQQSAIESSIHYMEQIHQSLIGFVVSINTSFCLYVVIWENK